MMSYNYAISPTRGNWFQTNQPRHESDDPVGNTVTPSVCVANEKLMVLSGKFDQQLSLYRGSVNHNSDGTGILVLVRILWDRIFKIYLQFWRSFFKNTLVNSYNFYRGGKWYIQFV